MRKPRRAVRIVVGVVLLVFLGAGLVALKLRIGVGPLLDTPPLVSAAPPAEALLFRDVTLFDGSQRALQPHRDVLIRDDRIVSVTATGTAVPAGAQVIPTSGCTLLPGFIDAHTHVAGSGAPPWSPQRVSTAHNLEAYVYAGVTTVYMLGGLAPEMATLRRAMDEGKLVGPQLYYTHLMLTAPGGHPVVVGRELAPWPLSAIGAALIPQPRDAAEAEQAVDKTAARNVHFIKVMVDSLPPSAPRMQAPVLQAIVAAAHRRGLKVFAHIGTSEDALLAARSGVDVLAHGIYRGQLTAAQAQELAQFKIPVIYTLAGFARTAQLGRGEFVPSALDEATVPAPILAALRGDAGRHFGQSPALAEFVKALWESEPLWPGNVQALLAAGVPLLIGTDSPLPAVFPGSAYNAELRVLAAAGVPNAELLYAATGRAADVLGLDSGRIQPGKVADLVLVRGDPLADIGATEQIELIILRGRLVRRLPR